MRRSPLPSRGAPPTPSHASAHAPSVSSRHESNQLASPSPTQRSTRGTEASPDVPPAAPPSWWRRVLVDMRVPLEGPTCVRRRGIVAEFPLAWAVPAGVPTVLLTRARARRLRRTRGASTSVRAGSTRLLCVADRAPHTGTATARLDEHHAASYAVRPRLEADRARASGVLWASTVARSRIPGTGGQSVLDWCTRRADEACWCELLTHVRRPSSRTRRCGAVTALAPAPPWAQGQRRGLRGAAAVQGSWWTGPGEELFADETSTRWCGGAAGGRAGAWWCGAGSVHPAVQPSIVTAPEVTTWTRWEPATPPRSPVPQRMAILAEWG
jgi:hypothetical protein